MCVNLDWTGGLALRDEMLKGCVLSLCSGATEDDEEIDITGVGRSVVTNSRSVTVAPTEIVAANACWKRFLEEGDQMH
jgi:hypothetical protein